MTWTRAVSVVWSGKARLEWVEKGIGKREFKMPPCYKGAVAKISEVKGGLFLKMWAITENAIAARNQETVKKLDPSEN